MKIITFPPELQMVGAEVAALINAETSSPHLTQFAVRNWRGVKKTAQENRLHYSLKL